MDVKWLVKPWNANRIAVNRANIWFLGGGDEVAKYIYNDSSSMFRIPTMTKLYFMNTKLVFFQSLHTQIKITSTK